MSSPCGLLDGEIALWRLHVPTRYVVTLVVVLSVKLVVGFLLYLMFGLGSGFYWASAPTAYLPQNQALVDVGSGSRWPLVFLGWDSAWYLTIAERGYNYVSESASFYPLLPALTWAADQLTYSPAESMVAVAFLAGVIWVPLFQLVCERYMSRDTALSATLLFALSPVSIVFTSVAYAEGLFLALTLTSWAFCQNRRYILAGLLAGLATLARPPGYVLIIPLGVNALVDVRKGLARRLASVALPTIVAVFVWWAYLQLSLGDAFAYAHSTKWVGMYTLPEYLTLVLPKGGAGALLFPVPNLPVSIATAILVWGTLAIAPFLSYRVFRVDFALGLYSAIYLFGSLGFGALVSVPRFLMALFPLWIAFALALRGKKWLQVLIVAESLITGFFLWAGFLYGSFVA